eukprot:SAG22_NODE_8143_length_680_cov_0.578313_1_plen_82_part_10
MAAASAALLPSTAFASAGIRRSIPARASGVSGFSTHSPVAGSTSCPALSAMSVPTCPGITTATWICGALAANSTCSASVKPL